MTAKTTKDEAIADEAGEVEAVPVEEEAAEEEAAEASTKTEPEAGAARKARPAAKRKRRVRVIEVIDDEDLDEVLEALDAEDEEEAEPAPRPAKPKPKPVTTAKAKPVPKPRPAVEPHDEEEPPAEPRAAGQTVFGLGVPQAVVIVVLVALLASLAIWQWRSASSQSSKQDARDAVSKVASAYGDVALNYNAQNYQSQMDKAQKLMGGDLLESFKKTTLPSLGETFRSNPEVALSSKTNQVFVGSVDDRFATAVVMVDIDVKTKDGTSSAPATLLRLALAKIDGTWKITKQYASGTNDQNQQQLPAVPGGGTSQSPKAEKSGKPRN